MRYNKELEDALKKEDFYLTNSILEKIIQLDNAYKYLECIFDFMEKNPEIDYGAPGPIVHFMENFYKKGYEKLLIESIQRNPTSQTIWMLNRIINDPNLKNKNEYLDILKSLETREGIDSNIKNEIKSFLKYQLNK